jgi:polysaccharide export outer membrane protein
MVSKALPVIAMLIAWAGTGWAGPAAASEAAVSYRLAPGDVVEFAVVGMPDLRQKAEIDVEGNVALPLIGAVQAAGQSLSDLRREVQQKASRSVVRQRTSDGREMSLAINLNEVHLSIAAYRPVYVDGDVSKPGEVVFRPGLTVRQALALAGGFDVTRFQINNPFLQGPDLASDYTILSAQLGRQQQQIARLTAELEGSPEPDLPAGTRAEQAAEMRNLELQQFRTRIEDREKRRASLRIVLSQLDAQLKALQEQKKSEEAGFQSDNEEMNRMKALLEKGTASMLRITDTRRNLLLSSTRLLQTTSQLERTRREREDVSRSLDQAENQDRLEILQQLQERRMELGSTRARIAATAEKLLYTSVVRSQLLDGTGGRPRIMVSRKSQTESARFAAEMDTELLPSDVVEIALVGDAAAYSPARSSAGEAGQAPTR